MPRSPSAKPCRCRSQPTPGEQFPGRISAINPKVEDSTRNVLVRAALANPDNTLLPGMFTSLDVLLPSPTAQMVVPESAITYTLYGNSVYAVAEKKNESGELERTPMANRCWSPSDALSRPANDAAAWCW